MGLLACEPIGLLTFSVFLLISGISGFLLDDATVQCDADVPFSLSEIPVLETGKTFYMIKLHKPYLVSRIVFNVEACKAFDRNAPTNITLTFVDADDVTEQSRKYSDNLNGTNDPDFISVMYNFPTTLYTENMVAVASDHFDCATLRIEGCESHTVCTDNLCKNGGTCISAGRCSCPNGYIGEVCDTKVNDIVIVSLGPTTLVDNTLYTRDGQKYNVSGEVALVPFLPESLNIPADGSNYLLFAGGNVTSVGINQTSRKRTFGFLHGLASVFSNFVLHGFTHTSTLHFGHHHHSHTIHLYNTYSGHRPGVALSYSGHNFYLKVDTGLLKFRLRVGWHPTHNGPHVITSSYCPSLGLSLHVNGHLIGSSAHGKPSVLSFIKHLLPPLCFGNCGHHHQSYIANYFLSHIRGTAGCAAHLATNGIAGLLGLPQAKVTTPSIKTTTKATTTTTTTPATPKANTFTATSQGSNKNTSTSHLLCYTCSGMPKDGACLTPKLCKSGEVCSLYKDPLGYNHRCLDATICKNAKAAIGQGCWECCNSSLCNFKCSSTVSAPCNDSTRCSLLKSAGYSVCNNPMIAKQYCKQTCGLCGSSG